MPTDESGFQDANVRAAPAITSPWGISTFDSFRPLIESVAKLTLAISVLLYSIGLFISNLYFQQFGLTGYSRIRAQYILVGLLWLLLVAVGGIIRVALFDAGRTVVRNWKSGTVPRFALFRRVVRDLFSVVAVLFIGVNVFTQLGARSLSTRDYCMIALTVAINFLSLRLLASAIYHNATGSKSPNPRFGDPLVIVSNCGLVLTTLVLYSFVVFPSLDQSLGGGRLHKIELLLKPERSLHLKQLGLDVTKDGRLGPVLLVSESSDGFLVTRSQSILEPHEAYRVSRDSVEAAK